MSHHNCKECESKLSIFDKVEIKSKDNLKDKKSKGGKSKDIKECKECKHDCKECKECDKHDCKECGECKECDKNDCKECDKHNCKECNRKKCKLLLNVEHGGTSGYELKQNDAGVYTVTADNIFEAFKGAGYIHTVDRIWQIFTFWALATGNLSTYLGDNPGNEASDTFFRSISPTDAQIDSQVPNLLPKSLNVTQGFLSGVNKRIDEVNSSGGVLLPLEAKILFGPSFMFPNITIYAYVRMGIAAGISLSPNMFGFMDQLVQFSGYLTLLFNYANPIAMFNDLHPPQPGPQAKIRTMTTSEDNCTCENTSGEQPTLVKTSKITLPDPGFPIPDFKKMFDDLFDTWRKTGLPKLGGSYAIALSPDKTTTKVASLIGAPQQEYAIPGDLYEVTVCITCKKTGDIIFNNQGLAFFGLFAPFPTTSLNYDYAFSTSSETSSVLGRDAVILDKTTDVHLSRTEFIAGGTIPVPIYVSNDNTSYIFDLQTFAGINQVVGVRTALPFGSEILGFNAYEPLFSKNFKEFYKLCKKAYASQEVISQSLIFADSLGNIGAVTTGNWTQLSASINRQLPLTTFPGFLTLGINPYPPVSDMVVKKDLQDFNRPEGYYSNWNQDFAGCLESVDVSSTGFSVNAVNGNRGLVIDFRLSQLTKDGKINPCKYRELMINIGNTQVLSSGIVVTQSNGGAVSDLWMLYVPLILSALNTVPVTPEITAVMQILSAYQGDFIFPTNINNILSSPTISDGFMLLAAIESELKWDLFGSQPSLANPGVTFADLFPDSSSQPTVGNPIPIVVDDQNILGGPLLSALGGGFNGNTNQFDWTNGVDPNTLIVNAVNTALVNLGGLSARPWGLFKRGNTEYQASIFGIVPGVPVLNRSAYYKITNMNKCELKHKDVSFAGQSGDPLSPHYVDEKLNTEQWRLVERKTDLCYDSNNAKSKLDGKRIRYVYSTHPGDSPNTTINNC